MSREPSSIATLQGTARTSRRPPSECVSLDREQLRLLAESFARARGDGGRDRGQLMSLIEIGLRIGSERDPKCRLQALCRAARNILGARQAVLAIHRVEGTGFEHVVTSGVDETVSTALQTADLDAPLLAEAVDELRCKSGTSFDGEPEAAGLPADFPRVDAWLVAPIHWESIGFGWICFIDKTGAASFNRSDEMIATTLASEIGRICEKSSRPSNSKRDGVETPKFVGPTEEDLRSSEELFRSAFDHTNVAMALTGVDNKFLRVNAAFSELFGYSESELLSMSMTDVTNPEDLGSSHAERKSLVRGSQNNFQIEKRYVHRSGRTVWGLTNVSLMRGVNGEPLVYIGQVQDITQKKRMEAALLESERRFRTLAEYSADGVFVNKRGRIVYANPALLRMLGAKTEADLEGTTPDDFIHPDGRHVVREKIKRILDRQETVPYFDGRFVAFDGSIIDVELAATPFYEDGEIAVMVTARRRRERVLPETAAADSPSATA